MNWQRKLEKCCHISAGSWVFKFRFRDLLKKQYVKVWNEKKISSLNLVYMIIFSYEKTKYLIFHLVYLVYNYGSIKVYLPSK